MYLQVPFFLLQVPFLVKGAIINEIYDDKNQLTSADTKNKLLQVLASTVFFIASTIFLFLYDEKNQLTSADTKNKLLQVLASTGFFIASTVFFFQLQ